MTGFELSPVSHIVPLMMLYTSQSCSQCMHMIEVRPTALVHLVHHGSMFVQTKNKVVFNELDGSLSGYDFSPVSFSV